jgi:hypothetical protein
MICTSYSPPVSTVSARKSRERSSVRRGDPGRPGRRSTATDRGRQHPADRGDLIGASLTLAWRELDLGGRMDVDGLAILLADGDPDDGEDPRARAVDRVDLPATPAVRVRSSLLAPVPESSRRQRVAQVQYYIPVPDTPWIGVLTVSTPNRSLAPVMTDLADRVATSLEFRTGTNLPPRLGTIGGRSGPSG